MAAIDLFNGIFLATLLFVSFAHATVEDDKVYNEIFLSRNYSKLFRPTSSVVVKYALSIAAILEVNEKEGYLVTTMIPRLLWVDSRLSWDKRLSAIDSIQVPDNMVWKPDMEVLNRYKDTVHDNSMNTLVWINRDGTIYYVPRHTYHTPCSMDLTHFPFDTQTCYIVHGSWAYIINQVDFTLINNGTDTTFYVGHTDWDLISFNMTRKLQNYSGPIPFVELVTEIVLSRRSNYFYYMYLLPVNFNLFLIPVIHLLPANRDARISMIAGLLICVTVMMGTLQDFLPGYYASTTPNILKLYVTVYMSLIISSVISAVSINLATGETKTSRVPNLVKKLFLTILAKIFLVDATTKQNYELLSLGKSVLERSNSDHGEEEMNAINSNQESSQELSQESPVAHSLQFLVGEMQIARHNIQLRREWIHLSQVIDRLTCIGFIISAFIVLTLNHSK